MHNTTDTHNFQFRRRTSLLKKEYVKNLVPVSLSVLGGTVNVLIDNVFISRKHGAAALAAVNMSIPVYLFMCFIGALVAGGGCVRAADALGHDDTKQAEKIFRTVIFYSVCAGIILTASGLLLADPVSGILGQGRSISGMICEYISALLPFTAAFIALYIPTFFLQLEGKSTHITIMSLIMIALDALLDWVLMYVLSIGLKGAALASGISTLLAAVYGIAVLGHGSSVFSLRSFKAAIKPEMKETRLIIKSGSAIALGNLLDLVRLLILNSLIFRIGGENAAAVWAVMNTFFEISLMITSGFPQAGAPMIGVFSGAMENTGIRILNRIECQTGLIASAVFSALLLLFADRLAVFFIVEADLRGPFICLGLTVPLQLIASVWSSVLNNCGRSLFAGLLVIMSRFLLPVATALLLTLAGAYIWLFLPVAALLVLAVGLLVSWLYSRRTRNTPHELSSVLLLDDYLEREHKVLDFSIHGNGEDICNASEQLSGFCLENDMNPKMTIRLQLSIEELLTVIRHKNPKAKSIDLRAFALPETTGIRVRCAGSEYDPFQDEDIDDEAMMGIRMLQNMADKITYNHALGLNNISIFFSR